MKTKHFANRIDYLRDSGDGPKPVYQGEEVKVHAMSDEELEEVSGITGDNTLNSTLNSTLID